MAIASTEFTKLASEFMPTTLPSKSTDYGVQSGSRLMINSQKAVVPAEDLPGGRSLEIIVDTKPADLATQEYLKQQRIYTIAGLLFALYVIFSMRF